VTPKIRRNYDHRIREQVADSGNIDLFPDLAIPHSTARSWIRRGVRDVVMLDDNLKVDATLCTRIRTLERRVAVLAAVVRLLLVLIRVSGFELQQTRLPEGAAKQRILQAVRGARRALSLKAALRVLRLNPARYHAWVHAQTHCALEDRSSCPRTRPQRLTYEEIQSIGDMVHAKEYRHMPIRALALHAQRIGKVFAHPATWGNLMRQRGWGRPRLRLYPPKPKIGLRSKAPNEAWHVDVSIVRLLDGTRAYLHAVIDNFSRRILAWEVADHLDPMNTCRVLEAGAQFLSGAANAAVYMDSGVENVNQHVDALISRGTLKRVLAQVDVSFSNSLIEAWWRSLKHQWLYLHSLDSVVTVRRLVAFYVTEHNERVPHSAFRGQTPDEMYFGTGNDIAADLAQRRRVAREQRLATNARVSCSACPRSPPDDKAEEAA
jgi:putative transposase